MTTIQQPLPLENHRRAARMNSETVNVVLPAGGRIEPDFARQAGTEIKALIRLNGKTILRRTLEALQATGRVGKTVVIGPEAALDEARKAGATGTLAEGATGPENIFRGMEWLAQQGSAADRLLVVTTDLPFLTSEVIQHFLDTCPPQADIAVPIIPRRMFEARFPGSVNTFTRLREGEITPGCVFLVNPQTLLRHRAHIESVFAARKNELAMARLIGLPFLLRYLTGQLAVSHIEQRCRQILGCVGAAVHNAPPELAFDIDLPVEYAYALARMTDGKETPR